MTAKNFFYYVIIIDLMFGLGLLIAPQMVVDMYAAQKGIMLGTFDVLARGYGTLLTTLGIGAYWARNAGPSVGRQALFIIGMVSGILASILHIWAIQSGVENSMAWSIVFFTAIAAVWAGLLLSKEKDLNLQ